MGKTQGGVCTETASSRYGSSQEVVEGIRLRRPDDPGYIGSATHLRRLGEYARGRTGRRDVSVVFSGACGRCGHPLDQHPEGQGCTVDGCTDCQYYIPKGGSSTNMRGFITVQSDRPPDQGLGAREIAINALLRHEVCHELYTNPQAAHDFFKQMERMSKNGQGGSANTFKDIWNILEDGMIETREREQMPDSYRFISAMNKIFPRVGQEQELREEMIYAIPQEYIDQGYQPEDADGNPLQIEQRDGQNVIVAPAGTKIGPWGEKPIYPQMQIRSALLAAALPEFSPGTLHPNVQSALDQCQPHIEAAITGNTADCIYRAQQIQQILIDHDLIIDPEKEKELNEAFQKMMEEMGPIIGDFPDPGEQGQQAPQPQNGGNWGQPQPPSPTGGSGGEGQGEDDQQQGEQGSGGSGSQEDGQQQEGQGSGGSQGEDGDPSGERSSGGSGGQDSGSSDPGTQRGGVGGDGHSEHNPVSAEQMRQNEQQGKGSASEGDVEEMKKAAERQLESDRAQQIAADNSRINKGHIEADQYQFDDRSHAVPQADAVARARQRPIPLDDEQGEMKRQGSRIAKIVKKLKAETVSKSRRRLTGRLDHRKLSRAMAGEPRIMERRGQKFDVDLEIDISIDLSGSMSGERLTQAYRAAMAVAHACQEAEVPVTIYGWRGGGGGAQHIALKERHSDDLTGIASMFSYAGGGTPTGQAIQLARRRLANSKAKNRVAIVQTDGGANDPDSARDQAEMARKQGLDLIGLGYQVDEDTMAKQFGQDYESIDTFERTYDVIAEMIEKAARRAAGKKSRI